MKKCMFALMCMALLVLTAGIALAAGAKEEEAPTGSSRPANDGPFAAYDPEIILETVKKTDAAMEDNLAQLQGITGETFDDHRWTRLFKDELGIDVEYRWIATADQFTQKWKMSMASGDLPDAVKVSLTDLRQLADADLIQEMGSVWDEYAAPLTKEVVLADGDAGFTAATIGGKVMGLPQVMAAMDYYRYLWLRTDWLDKFGLEPPETMDDLITIMQKFVEEDPDGNGEDDTYAMLLDKDLWFRLEGFFWCFGAYPDSWIEDGSGNLVFGAVQPEMKDALRILQQMYDDGWLDKEFVVKDPAKATEIVASGKCGVVTGGHWEPGQLFLSKNADPNAEWGCFEWPGINGKTVVGELELGIYDVIAVNKDYEYPEAVVKILNMHYEKLYGETGDYSTWGNAEVPGIWAQGPFPSFHPLQNVLAYRDIQKVFAGTMDAEELEGVALDYYNGVLSHWAWERMLGEGNDVSCYQMNRVVSNRDLVFTDNFVGAPTETMVERKGPLDELINTTVVKIITGELPVDTGFATFVEDWKRLGGTKITEEVNEWYKTNVLME